MDKRQVVKQVQAYLAEELAEITSSKPDAEAASRAGEIQQLLLMYRHLPMREYGPEDVACPASLVELDLNGTRAYYFIVPRGGGLIMKVDGKAVQVITPNSPIGEALLGRKQGDDVEVKARDTVRRYRVISVR